MSTYLTVSFAQKDQAKALGARWDAARRQWYVPEGLELTPFQEWLPSNAATNDNVAYSPADVFPSVDVDAVIPPKGIQLSQLLSGVEKAVNQAYGQGIWTRVDVVNVTTKSGHVYLELSERDERGTILAQARGTIWARTAERILPEFELATGAQLAPGIKLLVLAKPVFKAQYGFSIDISGIDASYTIGDLEAQKRKIREKLHAEHLFERNKRLPAPWDFTRVLVIAPQAAAGLGDFVAEAKKLHIHNVCEFLYVHSRFQGPGAAAEILTSIQEGIRSAGPTPLDALIIIRGGGASNDLAWLNDYQLARFICLSEIPVWTGIGHQRDSTILDEVAQRSFDTPSKVAAAIEKQIVMRSGDAKDDYECVLRYAQQLIQRAAIATERLQTDTRTSALATLSTARSGCEQAINQVRFHSHDQVHAARHESNWVLRDVKAAAKLHVLDAKRSAPSAMTSIKELSTSIVRSMNANVSELLPTVLEHGLTQANRSKQDLKTTQQTLFSIAQQLVKTTKTTADGLVREIAGQGPKKTLARGFAVVKNKDGKTVTSAKMAKQAGQVAVTFKDGVVHTTVQDA